MQHIGKLIPSDSRESIAKRSGQATARQASRQPPIPDAWVDQLFARFASIWPRQWAQTMAIIERDALRREWAEALAGMSGAQIRAGIEQARSHCDWPPSIAEFVRACQEADGRTAEQRARDALAAEQADALALPSRTWAERRADGFAQIREIRGLLNANPSESA